MKHSSVGASVAHRYFECPGSVALCESVPPAPSSPYAEEGIAAHELAEKCLRSREEPEEYIGQFMSNEWQVTEDMAAGVRVYVDTVLTDAYKMGFTMDKLDEFMQIEQKFHLSHIDEDAFGTNDCNFGEPFGLLRVYDYKNGSGVAVEVENNKQMLYYALGAAAQGDYTEIELVIVQPNAPHRDGPVRRWRISADELQAFASKLKIAIDMTRVKDAPLNPGSHCRFCPAAGCCPAIHKQVMTSAQLDFKQPMLMPEKLTVRQIKQILDNADLINNFVAAVEVYAQQTIEHGGEIPGYKLVKKKSNRKWRDEGEVLSRIGARPECFTEPKLKSPAQLEKLLGKKEVEELCYKPDTGNVLVSETDPRPSVIGSVIADFTEEKET